MVALKIKENKYPNIVNILEDLGFDYDSSEDEIDHEKTTPNVLLLWRDKTYSYSNEYNHEDDYDITDYSISDIVNLCKKILKGEIT